VCVDLTRKKKLQESKDPEIKAVEMKQLVNSHDSTTCYVELAVEARSRVITMHPYPIFLSKNSKSESNMTPAPLPFFFVQWWYTAGLHDTSKRFVF
jgi:hypothetical protein